MLLLTAFVAGNKLTIRAAPDETELRDRKRDNVQVNMALGTKRLCKLSFCCMQSLPSLLVLLSILCPHFDSKPKTNNFAANAKICPTSKAIEPSTFVSAEHTPILVRNGNLN